MVVEHIFANHHKLVNAFLDEDFEHLAFELHDVVVQRIVPFSHHFDDGKPFLVIGEQDFDVEGIRPKMVPLGVDVIVVNGFIEIELIVLSIEKRGSFIERSGV